MFVQTTDVNKNTRHFNLLYDKVPVVLSDGRQNWLTNTHWCKAQRKQKESIDYYLFGCSQCLV